MKQGAAALLIDDLMMDDEDEDERPPSGEIVLRGRNGVLRRLAAHQVQIDVGGDDLEQDSLTGLRLVPGGRRLQ